MTGKIVAPAISLSAFNCPHCATLTTQNWARLSASWTNKNSTPLRFHEFDDKAGFLSGMDKAQQATMREFLEKMATLSPFISDREANYCYNVGNLDLSRCFHCDKVAIWVGDAIVWPEILTTYTPNSDMPDEIAHDFREAASIVEKSPRGAAALLRLCVQKLCVALGQRGQNINDDIKSLVSKGLDVRVQRALDVVRVIGNNAVHPGRIDLRDDTEAASKLFGLVNTIVDIMISQPKHLDELYGSLGDGPLNAIEKRDEVKLISDRTDI